MKIAAIHYTKLPPQCDNIKQNLFDLTEFRMQGPLHDIKVYVSDNVTDTLNSIADEYDWAVIVATGNYFHQQQLILNTVEHAAANNSPLICHIMHRGGYFYLHPQWFAVDLKVWKSVGCPSFEESGASTFTTVLVERSAENFHDDYTPFWIKAGSEQCSYTTEFGFYGTKAIRSFIEAGHTVINLPNTIRNQKFYSYPDSNHQQIEQIINDPSTELPSQTPIHSFNDQIKLLRGNLDQGYYPVNTEKITDSSLTTESLDCFIGVCGGLKPAYIAGGPNFSEDSTVYLIDLSPAALAYQQYLIENWDGEFDKFDAVFDQFKQLHPEYNPLYFAEIGITKNLEWSLNNSEEHKREFTQRWKKYIKYKFHFCQIDLLDSATPLTVKSWLDNQKLGSYIWVSNSFYMDWLTFYKTKEGSHKIGVDFINVLKKDNRSLIVYENCGYVTRHYPK